MENIKKELCLIGDSLIRPFTLSKYIMIKNRHINLDNTNIVEIANNFIEIGIDNGIRGDLLFIMVLYLYRDLTIPLPANYDIFSLFNKNYKADNIHQAIIDSINKLKDMSNDSLDGENCYDGVNVSHLLEALIKNNYDTEDYKSLYESGMFKNSYLHQYYKLYTDIYDFEKELLMQDKQTIRPVTKADICGDNLQTVKAIAEAKKSNYHHNNNLVFFSNKDKETVAILLSQKYSCPFVYDNDINKYSKFNVINADEVN